MNKLVEHMEKHHAPIGTAYESTRTETVLKETPRVKNRHFKQNIMYSTIQIILYNLIKYCRIT